jgi:hypothetical protein
MTTLPAAGRGYRFIPAVMQYSGGVAAEPGHRLLRARFMEPVPLAEGFGRIATFLKGRGVPLTAFCACELRSPEPFTEDGFRAFNEVYAGTLAEWEVLMDGANPVARSNVCPEIAPPAAPAFHAFCWVEKGEATLPTFAVAGSGEAREGMASYREATVALGDTSPAGLRAKADFVLGEMERRMGLLGFAWRDTTAVQAYTVHDLHPFLAEAIVARGAARHGLTWQYCRPPVQQLEYEMDCRGIAQEFVLPG